MPDALLHALDGLRAGGALEAERLHAGLQQRMFGGPARPVSLGRFAIIERIGEGAMGEVYAAHDPDLDRRVALKLIRPLPANEGSESEHAHQRLRKEAQAMARLSHPNVVTVHEVGQLRDRVYLVMELVEGMDLRRWLERTRSWREIVAVFLAAGRGLAAAHAAGVIHRDFKPHNVLVGDDGRVRVADFGLAGLERSRSIEPNEPNASDDLTQTGAVLGTPAYMAPEQRRGAADARADQYAFCVALYEALHGHRPGDQAQDSPARDGGPTRLAAVVKRGLQEEPEARYPSMTALLVALDRARRRRWAGAATVLVLGTGGLLVAALPSLDRDSPLDVCRARASQWDEVWSETSRSKLAQRLHDDVPERADEVMDATSRAIEIYGGIWRSELRDACEATHAQGLQSAPVLSQRLDCLDGRMDALAVLLEVLAEPSEEPGVRETLAVGQLPAATTCRTESLPPPRASNPQLDAMANEHRERIRRARVLTAVGRSTEAVELLGDPPFEVTDERLLAQLYDARASALSDAGQFDAAREALVATIVAAEQGGAPRLRVGGTIALAELIGHRQAQAAAGLEWAAVAGAMLEGLPSAEPLRVRLHHARGNTRFSQGRYEAALAEHRSALDQALGQAQEARDDSSIGAHRMTLANTLLELGRTSEAREQLEHARTIYERTLGPSHPRVGLAHANLSSVALAQGKLDEAAEHARKALAIFERSRPPGHPHRGLAHNALGTALASAGDFEGSIEPFERAVEVWSESLGPRHPRVGNAEGNLALALFGMERYAEALAHGRAALEIELEAQGPEHPDVALVRATLARTLLALDRPQEALEEFERARDLFVAALGPDHAQLGPVLLDLGRTHLALDRPEAAIEVLRRGRVIFEATGATPVQKGGCEFQLGTALWRHGDTTEALVHLRAAKEHYGAAAPAWREQYDSTVDRWAAEHGVALDKEP